VDSELTDWSVRAADEGGDPAQTRAVAVLRSFFRERNEQVFFSRQVEVIHEGEFFHWVTNRAIRELEAAGEIASDVRRLKTGGEIKVLWNRSFRYFRRAASQVVRLVELYSNPNIGAALGLHGEMMVLEGFARHQFVLRARAVRNLDGATWTETEHNMDSCSSETGSGMGSR
jgi:hypothetical protein